MLDGGDGGPGSFHLLAFENMAVQIEGVKFDGGRSPEAGGAISLLGGVSGDRLKLVNTIFVDNESTGFGGGAVYVSNGNLTITGGSFNSNQAQGFGNGGAVYVVDSSLTVNGGTVFEANSSNGDGGAVFSYQSASVKNSIDIVGASFLLNSAQDYGAVGYIRPDTVTVQHSTFSDNSVRPSDDWHVAGALGGIGGNLNVRSSTFIGNDGLYYGGAIGLTPDYNEPQGIARIENSIFESNHARTGGAIATFDVGLRVSGSRFGRSGSATTCDVPPLGGNHAAYGGAINLSAESRDTQLEIDSSQFFRNCAISLTPESGSGDGGAIYIDSVENFVTPLLPANLQVTASMFVGNGASSDGGAIYAETGATSLTRIVSNEFSENGGGLEHSGEDEDRGQGGAVRLSRAGGLTNFLGNRFVRNHAEQGGAVSMNDGYGDVADARRWTLRGNLFTDNRANDNGGALHLALDNSGAIRLRNVTNNRFVSNLAYVGGAIVVESDRGNTRQILLRFSGMIAANQFRANRAPGAPLSARLGVHFDE